MVVLSCAAVGIHGRDSFAPVRGLVVTIGAFLLCSTALAQPSSTFRDLLPDLADKIASTLGASARATLAPTTDEQSARDVDRDLAALLTARGLRIAADATSPASASIAVSCGENLRERACVAEIRRGEVRDIVSATKAHAVHTHEGDAARTLAIEAMPLFAQRARILDVLTIDDRLVVLDTVGIAVYRRANDDWQLIASRAVEPPRIWPRDVRGRLRLSGSAVEAFLPGVVCQTTPALTNFTCADQREPWPLAVENAGLDSLRNTFQTPEGTPFFSAATLDAAAGARTVIVDVTHSLVLMDETRAPVGTIGTADDVASVAAPCRTGAYIVTSAGMPGTSADALQLWRLESRTAIRAATPVALPGRMTALWSTAGAKIATAIVRDTDGDRYAAFQIRISCNR